MLLYISFDLSCNFTKYSFREEQNFNTDKSFNAEAEIMKEKETKVRLQNIVSKLDN